MTLHHVTVNLANNITGSTTLRELHIGWNKIGDGGISLISWELQQNNSLTKLIVRDCGLLVKGKEQTIFACTV